MLLKNILSLVLAIGCSFSSFSQTVTINMTTNCFNPSIVLPYAGDFNGRPAYDTNSGNLGGISPAQLSVYWNGAQWQILVGGGTLIYTHTSNSSIPPASGWVAFAPAFPLGTCGVGDPAPILSGAVLPIELVSFRAKQTNKMIELDWSTASETNNEGFEIEKSNDGITWGRISFEEGNGTSNKTNDYQFKDSSPYNGLNYFRLRQIDFDNNFEYSKVIKVDFIGEENRFFIAPNPFTDLVDINFMGTLYKEAKIEVYNYSGVKFISLDIEEEHKSQSLDLSFLDQGIYYMKAISGKNVWIQKIIKQ